MNKLSRSISMLTIVMLILLGALGSARPVRAAAICVEPSGAGGCYITIQAAITAATDGDTINIAAGTYNENVVIDKDNLSLIGAFAMTANLAPNPVNHTIIDSGAPALTTSPGITINSGITGITIKNLRVQNFSSNSGIYGALGNDNLTIDSVHVYNNNSAAAVNGGGIYMNGPVSDVLINKVDSQNNKQRGIVIWNGFKQNITITNNYVKGNTCCGIELQDGTASGVTISNNTVISNADSGIAAIGLTSGAGANLISNNTVTNNGRFGIEIKMPNGTGAASGDGSIVIENNTVSLPTPGADLRDFAGIAVFRRAYQAGYGYADIPTGVIIRNNTVSDYIQPSSSTGFGIVVEGTKMKVEGNTLTNNDVGIQVQSGHLPYTASTAGDGDQTNVADEYFGRGNSPTACVYVPVGSNTYTTNGVNSRLVGTAGTTAAQNTDTGAYFCSIQSAIDDPATLAGHTISVPAGTYIEDITISKSLTLLGPNSAINPNTGTRVAEAILSPASSGTDPSGVCIVAVYLAKSDTTIKGFTVDGNNSTNTSGVLVNGVDVDACEGVAGWEGMENTIFENNIVKNTTYTGVDFDNYTVSTPTAGNYIRYNKFDNIGNATIGYGIGVLIYDNFYADITDNVFDHVRVGIQTGNYSQANPGTTGSISDNTISAWRMGIFHNLWYSDASTITVSDNTINAISSADSTKWNGMLISSFQGTVNTTISNNTINIGTITQNPATGYNIWNTPTTAALTISGGTVNGGNYGVWVNNFEGYASNADNTSIIVDGVTINDAATAGVYVSDSASNTNGSTVYANILNSAISTSATGILLSGTDATAKANLNQITGNATAGITNTSGNALDAEKNWWGHITGPSGANTGSGDAVSANIDFTPWCGNAACSFFVPPYPLVVTANNASKAYGDILTFASNQFSTTGLVFSDTVNSVTLTSTGAANSAAVGAYPIVASAAVGTGLSNYTLSYTDGTLTVNKAVLTVTAANKTKAAGAIDPAFTYTMTGFKNSETAAVVNTAPTCGVLVPHNTTGTYPIICSAGSDNNYSFSYINGTLTVSPVTATFADVPITYWAWQYIERLYSAGVTSGCSSAPLNYCPDSSVTRAEMAVFLLKGIHGSNFAPPVVGASTGFGDVAIDYWAAAWIKQLAMEGITIGCGNGNYCPTATVTRAQMAVFLLKAKHGASYNPPAATGIFSDVPIGYWADKWIEQLSAEGVTSGCGTGIYCPDADVTRAQMAVFLVKAFSLP